MTRVLRATSTTSSVTTERPLICLASYLQCPDCGIPRTGNGFHDLSVRTVFDYLKVKSPRLHHCGCRPHESKTFIPLTDILPEHMAPELLFLKTKGASLMSYGMTTQLMEDVLSMDDPLNAFTIRSHVLEATERWRRNWVKNNNASSKPASETGPTSQFRTDRSQWALMVAMRAATASKVISECLPARASWHSDESQKRSQNIPKMVPSIQPTSRREGQHCGLARGFFRSLRPDYRGRDPHAKWYGKGAVNRCPLCRSRQPYLR